jgi:hypothetical protein
MATSRQRKTRAPRASRASIAHRATAWQCGVAQLPGYVGGEGEPFRPVGIFWMNEDGMLIGSQVAHPDSLEDQIIISLEQVMARPLAGLPQRPSRIRVKSPGIAALLQANTVGIDIVCGPTLARHPRRPEPVRSDDHRARHPQLDHQYDRSDGTELRAGSLSID